MELPTNINNSEKFPEIIDVVIVGAGFAGLYMLHRLREHKISARVFEAGDDIGGTWYWNRYPGARCDVESMQYSYSFSAELQQEWQWKELYASQPEILSYINHVADKFDLRRDIQLKTRVITAVFNESLIHWEIETEHGERFRARFCIMATGCLSSPRIPLIPGLDDFKGNYYHTARWPHEAIDFTDRRVAVLGTGSSGIQSIPCIAKQASHVFVFQRTANFSIPARNTPLDPEYERFWKADYAEQRRKIRESTFGILFKDAKDCPAISLQPDERQEVYESQWQTGGFGFLASFSDLVINKESNETAAEFVRSKIRSVVVDPTLAEALLPNDHPIGTKRLCVDSQYYETFNRNNITLVDLRNGGIDEITSTGIRIKDKVYEVDNIVFATGFDAMTGALLNIDIRGRLSKRLRDTWIEGPRTYLGIMIADFPNLFMITGPGSPSVLSNMIPSIEQHVEWITDCLEYLRSHDAATIEATTEAENTWVAHVNELAHSTLFAATKSWYTGANIPGKPRIFMPYVGGINLYREKCTQVAADGYDGFILKKCPQAPST